MEEFEFEHKGRVRCIPAGARWVDWLASTTESLWDIQLNGTSVGQVEANLEKTKETVHKAATRLIDELPAQWVREELANGELADSELQQETVAPEVAEETAPPAPPPLEGDSDEDEPLLKAAEVGKMLGIPTNNVYQLPINRVRVGKRTVRWRPAAVREFIEQGGENPLPGPDSR